MPRTVPTKVPYIQDILQQKKHLFGMITETWLRDHLNAEIHIPGYTIFRSDCKRPKKRRGRDTGGAAIYIREDIAASAETALKFSNGTVDILCVYIKAEHLLLSAVYRQTDDTIHGWPSKLPELTQGITRLRKCLNELPNPTPTIIIGGDFNFPHAIWPSGTAGPGAPKEESDMITYMSEFAENFHLVQCIPMQATHKAGNMLDLMYTNSTDIIHSINSSAVPTIYSDHFIIEFTTTMGTSTTRNTVQPNVKPDNIFDCLNFFSNDTKWEELEEHLKDHNWKEEFNEHNGHNSEQMLSKVLEVSGEYSKIYVPEKTTFNSHKEKIPRHRVQLMRHRTRCNKQLKNPRSIIHKQNLINELREIEKTLQKSYRNQRDLNEKKAVDAIKTNAKYFYSYSKKFSKVKSNIGPLMDNSNNLESGPQKMAEILSEQYKSVFSEPMNTHPITHPNPEFMSTGRGSLYDIEFTKEDLIDAIDDIPLNAAAGPDRFPAILLKKCKNALVTPLYMVWRKSLDESTVPSFEKHANITPIHKGGSRATPKNYRPIALTSHLIKIFEKVIRKYIVAYIEENSLFNDSQHGFRSGRSCLSQLLAHYDLITSLLESGHNVDVVYLDFAKAFDKVDFNITLSKLHSLGITGKLHEWIHNFLTPRTQSVIVNGEKSKPVKVLSGVPQGSVLGPLLFLILLGDIDSEIKKAYVSSFADDTRLTYPIDSDLDVEAMQSELETIYQWAAENNSTFNSSKFECMRYRCNKNLNDDIKYHADGGSEIDYEQHLRDLGVTVSDTASFDQHIHNIVLQARQKSGWIFRTFHTRARFPMIIMWKQLVRPILDYCSQLWSPSTPGLINRIESVQKSFVRKIAGMSRLDYWEQLKTLNINSLERRRERYLIIYTWRILQGQVPYPSTKLSSFTSIRNDAFCRIPKVKTSASAKVQTLRRNSFAVKGPQLFNKMPQCIRDLSGCTTAEFKKELDEVLTMYPDEPRLQGMGCFSSSESNSLLHVKKKGYRDNSVQRTALQ